MDKLDLAAVVAVITLVIGICMYIASAFKKK